MPRARTAAGGRTGRPPGITAYRAITRAAAAAPIPRPVQPAHKVRSPILRTWVAKCSQSGWWHRYGRGAEAGPPPSPWDRPEVSRRIRFGRTAEARPSAHTATNVDATRARSVDGIGELAGLRHATTPRKVAPIAE